MLTLEQLISEATALPDAGKAILIDKIVESMMDQKCLTIVRISIDLITEAIFSQIRLCYCSLWYLSKRCLSVPVCNSNKWLS